MRDSIVVKIRNNFDTCEKARNSAVSRLHVNSNPCIIFYSNTHMMNTMDKVAKDRYEQNANSCH